MLRGNSNPNVGLIMAIPRIEVGQLHGTTKMAVELKVEVTISHAIGMRMRSCRRVTIGRVRMRQLYFNQEVSPIVMGLSQKGIC